MGLMLVVSLLGWPRYRRAADLEVLSAAGAVFDTRSRAPTWMKFEGCDLDDSALQSLSRIDSLRDLVLDESNITDDGLVFLQNLRDLRRVSLVRTPITDDGMPRLAHLDQLKTLILDSSYQVTGRGLSALAHLPQLEELSVLDTTLELKELLGLSAKRTSLQINSSHGVLGNLKLALSGTEITDDGLLRLHDADQLVGLELPSRITDRGFRHLHGLSRLRFLVASGTDLTDKGLADVVQRLPLIEELDLSGCQQLTDRGLAQLSALKHLNELKLDRTATGPNALNAIAKSARLKLLSLDGCHNVDDAAIGELMNQLPGRGLVFLRLSRTRISELAVAFLDERQAPTLKGLDLRGAGVDANTARLLTRQLPGCRVLH